MPYTGTRVGSGQDAYHQLDVDLYPESVTSELFVCMCATYH